MNLKLFLRLTVSLLLILIAGLISFSYWLESNQINLEELKLGPLKAKTIHMNTSKNLKIQQVDLELTNLKLSLTDISIQWKTWWILLGRIDSLSCRKVVYATEESQNEDSQANTGYPSFLSKTFIRSLNIQNIKIDSLKSKSLDLQSESLEGSLSGALLQVKGRNFNLNSLDSLAIHSPSFQAKFHFLTNRLILQKVTLDNHRFGRLDIVDLDLPIALQAGASISCRQLAIARLNQSFLDFTIQWKQNGAYLISFLMKNKGKLEVKHLEIDSDFNLLKLQFSARKFNLELNLDWLNNLFDQQLPALFSSIPHPLTSTNALPQFNSEQTINFEIQGNALFTGDLNLENQLNLQTKLYWMTPSSLNAEVSANVNHEKGQIDYSLKPLEITFSNSQKTLWSSKLNTEFAIHKNRIVLRNTELSKFRWKDTLVLNNLRSDQILLDSIKGIEAALQIQSVQYSDIMSAKLTKISLQGTMDNLRSEVELSEISTTDFGNAETLKAQGNLKNENLHFGFAIKNYSKAKSFSSSASGLITWAPQFSEAYLEINTGSLRIADYMNFYSANPEEPQSSDARYKWTIQAKISIDDEQFKGKGNSRLTFDHRYEGPAGHIVLDEGILQLAGHQLKLLQSATLKFVPKPKEGFKNEIIWAPTEQMSGQSLNQQLQTLWESSNQNANQFFDHGIFIQLLAGLKFRGEDLEMSISGKYPAIQFKLSSLSGKSEDELLKSFLQTLSKNSEVANQKVADDERKAQINLLTNTLMDGLFGSVFKGLGTQFHTQLGNTDQSSISIRQPLGEKLSIGVTQGREGSLETKSQNLQVELNAGSSLKLENIEKEGQRDETQVGIQKRFRF